MTQEHPITPPPELVQAFLRSNPFTPAEMTYEQFIATRFARWGADEELEACLEWLRCSGSELAETYATYLYRARRKPMSIKELAKAEIERLMAITATEGALATAEPIRCALDLLDD